MKKKGLKKLSKSVLVLAFSMLVMFCMTLWMGNMIEKVNAQSTYDDYYSQDTENFGTDDYQSIAPIVDDNSASVYDLANLLDSEEIENLEALIEKVEAKKAYRIVVVTTDYNPGTAMAYADDFFDFNGFGEDGILFLLDMDNREQWISTTGVCTEVSGEKKSSFSQNEIERILDETTPWASEGDYYRCLEAFVKEVRNHENLLHTLLPTGTSVVISIVLTVIVFVALIMQHKAKAPTNIANYKAETKAFQVGVNRAVFMGTQTNKRYIPPNNGSSGSGRSGGMHRSGSGRSHGGGVRKF